MTNVLIFADILKMRYFFKVISYVMFNKMPFLDDNEPQNTFRTDRTFYTGDMH